MKLLFPQPGDPLHPGSPFPPAAARGRQGGAILIVALGILTLLAVLGATFAQLMRLEKRAADNYVEAQHMDLLTNSAIDMVVAQLHDWSNRRSWSAYSTLQQTWLYQLKDERDLAHGRAAIDDNRVGRWTVYSELGGKRFRFKTKVIDTSAQINLNGRQDTLARMLDNLGVAIETSRRLEREHGRGRVATNPFYTEPNRGGNKVRGIDIMLFRQRLEGQRFQSKSQLRQLIGVQNYELVKDFLTCWSWEDPHTYAPTDGIPEVPQLSRGMTTAARGGGAGDSVGGSVAGQRQPGASENPRLASEPRHPINVNTAPEEVITACLMGLAGRRVFPYSQLKVAGGDLQSIDRDANIQGERLLFGQEEIRDVRPRAVFVYSARLERTHAQRLADRIVQQRKNPSTTFRTWRTNNVAQPGFEDFIDGLDADFFPSHANVHVIDPDQPSLRTIQSRIIAGAASPIGRLWQKGTAQGGTRSLLRSKGLAVHDSHAWYYEMMKGILKANFNPNTRINRYNPNAPVYVPVDKSDLVWAETRDLLRQGHTTEFCFDTMGIYEITTLGEMLDLSRMRPAAGRSGPSGRGGDIFPFRRTVRTVVEVFDVLRHTNQFHFEKTFQSGSRSSANDRRYVVTWPEPMAALTELYTGGSRRDGRVELAGLLDGVRNTIPVRNRSSFSGKHPSVLMEHGFQDRSPRSLTELRQALARGGGVNVLVGDQVKAALRGVFDADYSRYRPTWTEYYRRSRMLSLGAFIDDKAAWLDPLIGKEEIGTDLFPDGLSSSILRMPHLGNRMLVLPARQKIGAPALGGGGDVRVGASGRGSRGNNLYGNVPYYTGGLGFWVKFDFDGDDPVFSGLIGCTQVIRQVLPMPQDATGSEGTQTFIFKNSTGELRIVRMYYHEAFPEAGGEGGDGSAGVPQLYPNPGIGDDAEGDNPIADELDPQKWVSRSDILINVAHFKAHEWHHIAVDWNDQNPVFPIRLYLDFQEVREAIPRKAQQEVTNEPNSWVRLNERQPKDGLQIGGLVRPQGVADAGVFKWYTTTASTGRGGGVTVVAPTIKRILANATIDELITFESTFAAAKSYYGGRGQPGYFSNQVGEYSNVFEIPLPPEVDHVTLRSLDWTAYYPTVYTDSLPGSVPVQLQVTPMSCQVTYPGPSLPRVMRGEPWRQPTVDNFVAGKLVQRRRTGILGNNAEVVYRFRMTGARSPTGNTAGGVVQTPVLDDVTLTYFLPSPRILLQEEDF